MIVHPLLLFLHELHVDVCDLLLDVIDDLSIGRSLVFNLTRQIVDLSFLFLLLLLRFKCLILLLLFDGCSERLDFRLQLVPLHLGSQELAA